MKRYLIIVNLLVIIFGSSTLVLADEWSVSGRRVTQLATIDGSDLLRIFLSSGIGVNPANCGRTNSTIVDIQLNISSRSPEEQQLMLNIVYLAYITNRNIRLRISDSICTTEGVSASLPVALAAWVMN